MIQPQEKDVSFCTIEAPSVKGALFYKQLKGFSERIGEISVTGKLIFTGLKGWSTSIPVPSYSYLTGDLDSKKRSSGKLVPFYCYWTGDEKKICQIPILIRISSVGINRFDVASLNLEFYNPDMSDNIILSHDYYKNSSHFHLSYGTTPLDITGFEIKEGIERGDIEHFIVIYSSFTSRDT